jgi:hypothetical protein
MTPQRMFDREVTMPNESSTNSPQPIAQAPVVLDHQIHWYPRSAVDKLMRGSTYPKAERGGYVVWLDESIAMPSMC